MPLVRRRIVDRPEHRIHHVIQPHRVPQRQLLPDCRRRVRDLDADPERRRDDLPVSSTRNSPCQHRILKELILLTEVIP